VAAVYYDRANENSVPTSTTSIDPQRLLTCANDPLNVTVPAIAISSKPQGTLSTVEMHIDFKQHNSTSNNATTYLNLWSVNDVAYQADYSRSLLSRVQSGNASSEEDQMYISGLSQDHRDTADDRRRNLYDFGSNGTVRIVIYDHFMFAHHPMVYLPPSHRIVFLAESELIKLAASPRPQLSGASRRLRSLERHDHEPKQSLPPRCTGR
jgi:hypothetical protein